MQVKIKGKWFFYDEPSNTAWRDKEVKNPMPEIIQAIRIGKTVFEKKGKKK